MTLYVICLPTTKPAEPRFHSKARALSTEWPNHTTIKFITTLSFSTICRLSRDDTILSRGPSIVKSYSLLSETERRELIRRAFEMKDLLKKELDKTLSIIEEKNKELRRFQSQLDRGQLMVEGEREALDKDDLNYFPLFAEREYKEGSAAQMHFRLAGKVGKLFYRLYQYTVVIHHDS